MCLDPARSVRVNAGRFGHFLAPYPHEIMKSRSDLDGPQSSIVSTTASWMIHEAHPRRELLPSSLHIKSKFGDSLRSKADTAMVNEALAKVLCHHICCLIQSHYELGINAAFWGDEPVGLPAVDEPAEVNPLGVWAWV
jgi:hypothetical protein